MDINERFLQEGFFLPFMNSEEIGRIFNVNNGADYLLKLRADTVADHMRLFRVYRNRALINEGDWSFEDSFDNTPYEMFLNSVDEDIKRRCKKLVYGNVFSNDANGYIMNTEYGPLITVSDALGYFFKFMNLALLQHEEEVPDYVCKNAIRIAVRVMLKTETLDFLMDPRGIVTEEMSYNIHLPIKYEYMYIIGHEFAHYLLGHLDTSKSVMRPLYNSISDTDEEYMPVKVFSHSQQQELDADLMSLDLPRLVEEEYKKYFESALLWFSSLSIYEEATNLIFPQTPWMPSSHPSAKERIENILSNARLPEGFSVSDFRLSQANVESYREWIIDDVNNHFENYEVYGSVYLDRPNTEWRGKELKDRIDYY